MKKKIAMYFGDKPNNFGYDNGGWLSVLNIPFIATIEEAKDYDIIIRTLWLEASGWSREIRKNWPHVKQIGLTDHPLSAHISKLDGPRQYAYLSDLESLDALMVLTEEEREFYQTALPSKPVVKVGLPIPLDYYEEKYNGFTNSPRQYIGLGVGASDNDRNFISNLLVFERLLLEYPNLQGVFLSIPSQLLPYCAYLCDKYPNLFIHERTNMDDYYNILSQCVFVLSLADRNTPGRLQGEAAFFEVPVIGSNRFELQDELFPQWSVKPYELERATDLARWIIQNPQGARELAQKAKSRLVQYDYPQSKRKFNKILKLIGE